MSTELDKINANVMERFNLIKNRMKLNLIGNTIKHAPAEFKEKSINALTEEDFTRLQDAPMISDQEKDIIKNNMEYVDNRMKAIGSLGLSPDLSMVVGFIVAGDLDKALDLLYSLRKGS